jgi:protein transport protein SEC61 subunit gamma-like protein
MRMFTKLKEFYIECVRVLKVTKKPTNEELKTVIKVSGLGIIVIGLIGFIITILYTLMIGY